MGVRAGQRGIVLVASLLLLLVITILALAMFRSMGLSEKLSGNVREKQRALHAAVVAEQYAEYWLSSGNAATAPVLCNSTANGNVLTNILICNTASAINNPATVPWTSLGGAPVGFTYYPSSGSAQMYLVANSGAGAANYWLAPSFYIQYLGIAADGAGNVYKIDSVGYGGSALSVAVVESTYEVGSGVTNLGNP